MIEGSWKPPKPPREHGAWAMLLIAPCVGFAVAGAVTVSALAVLAGFVFLFLARYAAVPAATRLALGRDSPAGYLVRRGAWTALYASASATMLAVAVLVAPSGSRTAILAAAVIVGVLGGFEAALGSIGRNRTIAGELIGMSGLAAATPLTAAAAGAPLDTRAVGAGLFVFAYYVSSLSLVRAYKGNGATSAAAVCLAIQALLACALIVLWRAGWLPLGSVIAFAPVIGRAVWALASPPANLRALGLRELGVAVIFLTLAVSAFLR